MGVVPTSLLKGRCPYKYDAVRVAHVSDESSADPGVAGSDAAGAGNGDTPDALSEAQEAIADARRRLAEIPADVVVTNHAMGLYELAAIHLSGEPPDLGSAALAIDALAALVDGLGDRLGAEAPTLRTALSNIQMVFVQIKGAHAEDGAVGESEPPR